MIYPSMTGFLFKQRPGVLFWSFPEKQVAWEIAAGTGAKGLAHTCPPSPIRPLGCHSWFTAGICKIIAGLGEGLDSAKVECGFYPPGKQLGTWRQTIPIHSMARCRNYFKAWQRRFPPSSESYETRQHWAWVKTSGQPTENSLRSQGPLTQQQQKWVFCH